MARVVRTGAVALLLVAVACGGGGARPSEVEPTGPPTVRPEVVRAHAEQFDDELSDRPAGSQQEQAASQYILGHLQQAGYFVQLDAVPVEDLVESTNLVALPPSGAEPTTAVVVAYDAEKRSPEAGETIGVWLEVARALYVAEPDHRVEFVALGAERTADHLGSRRLAQQLIEQERDLDVMTLVPGMDRFGARGSLGDDLAAAAEETDVAEVGSVDLDLVGGVDVFERAGFDSALVGGPPGDVGAALLAFLAGG